MQRAEKYGLASSVDAVQQYDSSLVRAPLLGARPFTPSAGGNHPDSVNLDARNAECCTPVAHSSMEVILREKAVYSTKGGDEFFRAEQDWEQFGQEVNLWMQHIPVEKWDMPCMQETSGIICEEIDKFLARNWMSDEDIRALQAYKQKVEALMKSGYPYRQSLELAMLFPVIQGVFYALALPYEPGLAEDIRKCGLHELRKRWEDQGAGEFGLARILETPWHILYQDSLADDEIEARDLLIQSVFAMFLPELVDGQGSSLHLFSDPDRSKLFVPSFASATLEIMNKTHCLPVVYIQMSRKITEYHDGENMSCTYIPFHDLIHDFFSIHSHVVCFQKGTLTPKDEYAVRWRNHQAICMYYKYPHPERAVHCAGELVLFTQQHERGDELHWLGERAKCMDAVILVNAHNQDGVWLDLPEESRNFTDAEWMPKGALWINTFIEKFFSSVKSPELSLFQRDCLQSFQDRLSRGVFTQDIKRLFHPKVFGWSSEGWYSRM